MDNKSEVISDTGPSENLWGNSTWSLLITNILIIIIAVIQKWEMTNLLLVYYFQCVFIVIFFFLRLLSLKEYKLIAAKLTGEKAKSTKTVCLIVFAIIFLPGILSSIFFFGLMTAGLMILQARNTGQTISTIDIMLICISLIVLFINHLYSYKLQKNRIKKDVHIELFFVMPFLRGIPLFVFVIITANIIFNTLNIEPGINLLAFLIIKTILDIIMHLVEKYLILERTKQNGTL